jgi:amino-acid N-acetyltransferase
MNATMRIRPGRPDDAASVRLLVTQAGLPIAGLDQAWTTLVAEDRAGVVVGVAGLERHGPPAGRVFLLRSVAVQPSRRGSGLGTALVTAALAAADAEAGGTATVALLTETAAGYFDRFGFTSVKRDTLPGALSASPELAGACADTARAYLRNNRPPGPGRRQAVDREPT